PVVVSEWLKLADYRLLQARDSRFGITNGSRYGDRDSRRVDPNDPPSRLIEWYQPPNKSLTLVRDRRRTGRDWNIRAFVSSYLDPVRPIGGGNDDLSDVWIGNGVDR